MLSTPVMEIKPRFVSRAYPVCGGCWGPCDCRVVENERPLKEQLAHIERGYFPVRIILIMLSSLMMPEKLQID